MTLAPELWIIAGPNGSGKTTLLRKVIPPEIPVVNTDDIARRLAGNAANAYRFAMQAARQSLKDREVLIRSKTDLAVETTLSGQGIKRLVAIAGSAGYKINLACICLDSPDKSMKRIGQRVHRGGHDVPQPDIRRRYERSLENLPQVITQVDRGKSFDNSGKNPQVVADITHGRVSIMKPCKWLEKALYS